MPASEIIDDKSEHCIPFILDRLAVHQKRHATDPDPPPFFLGLNGVQGAGKTTMVRIPVVTYVGSCQNYIALSFDSMDVLRLALMVSVSLVMSYCCEFCGLVQEFVALV